MHKPFVFLLRVAVIIRCPIFVLDEAFRHVETLFVQVNIFVLNQNKPLCLVIKKRGLTIVQFFFYYQTRRLVLIQYEDITLDE